MFDKSKMPCHGVVADGFESVRDLFIQNFSRDDAYRETGAALTVIQNGKTLVDLWAGNLSYQNAAPWQHSTRANVFSVSKTVSALCLLDLLDKKKIPFDTTLSSLWPAFGAQGKDMATVSDLLSHQAGLPVFDEPVSVEDLASPAHLANRLAAQEPRWVPGEKTAYHAVTVGFLIDATIRNVAGISLTEYWQETFASPLQIEFSFGCADADHAATTMPPKTQIARPADNPLLLSAMTNPPIVAELTNTPLWRQTSVPSANGFASANAIAEVFGMIANEGMGKRGKQPVSSKVTSAMTSVVSDREDLMFNMPIKWGLGLMQNSLGLYGPDSSVFGHSGFGGATGIADLKRKLSIGYVCNQMGDQLIGDPRSTILANEIYKCL